MHEIERGRRARAELGAWRTDFNEITRSIQNKLYKLPPKTMVHCWCRRAPLVSLSAQVIPGHNDFTTIEAEMKGNPVIRSNV